MLFQLQDGDIFIAMNKIICVNVAKVVDHNRICHHLRYYTSLAVDMPLCLVPN